MPTEDGLCNSIGCMKLIKDLNNSYLGKMGHITSLVVRWMIRAYVCTPLGIQRATLERSTPTLALIFGSMHECTL
jgi:hypothetical protein